MTWKEFKDDVERSGINNGVNVLDIDIWFPDELSTVEVEYDKDNNGVHIYSVK